jgi:hypothetical protein
MVGRESVSADVFTEDKDETFEGRHSQRRCRLSLKQEQAGVKTRVQIASQSVRSCKRFVWSGLGSWICGGAQPTLSAALAPRRVRIGIRCGVPHQALLPGTGAHRPDRLRSGLRPPRNAMRRPDQISTIDTTSIDGDPALALHRATSVGARPALDHAAHGLSTRRREQTASCAPSTPRTHRRIGRPSFSPQRLGAGEGAPPTR